MTFNAAAVALAAIATAGAPLVPLPAQPPDVPWPTAEWPAADPGAAGLDAAALARALDAAFLERGPAPPARTRAVVIVHRGHLVAERYAPGFHRESRLAAWSVSKTVVNALVGILVADGRLERSATAPVAAWQGAGDPRRGITVEHLLTMSSGLVWSEDYTDPLRSDVLAMLFGRGRRDMASYAAARPLGRPPGERFEYSSGTTLVLSRLALERAAEGAALPERRLFAPLGMRTAVLERDAAGTWVGSSYLFASARDLARLGLLFLRDGVWEGRRLLPAGWVDFSRTAAPAAPRGEHGAHLWLNAGSPERGVDPPLRGVPADAFYAWGKDGQYVVMVPSLDAVVVRLGLTTDPAAWELAPFLEAVLSALPAAAPPSAREEGRWPQRR